MIWLYATLGLAIVLELLLGYSAGWRLYRPIVIFAAPLMTVASVGLSILHLSIGTVGIDVITAFSLFNMARIWCRRLPSAQLYRVANTTGLYLAALHSAVAFVSALSWHAAVPLSHYAAVAAVFQLFCGVLLLVSTRRQLRKTAVELVASAKPVAASQLPSITVAIPARNEDAQMAACLDAILASDYPKLEVIVLDDNSSDHTPEIIRGYAHDGVRFVSGPRPQDGWLPKNQAYDSLFKAASGKLLLFCGVDVRVDVTTIRQLEQLMHSRHKQMVTTLPQNKILRAIPPLQAMRYFWEVAPPRRLFRRPPILSSCWLVSRELLDAAGGFSAVRRSISPESHFAQAAIAADSYSFLRSNAKLGVFSEKDARDQYETAVYSRYPQLHRRPELVMLLCLAELVIVLGPVAIIVWSLLADLNWYIAVIAAMAYVLQSAAFMLIQTRVFIKASLLAAWLAFPATFATDVVLMVISMYKYEFSVVQWKQRNVSAPIMQVIPRLPKLP